MAFLNIFTFLRQFKTVNVLTDINACEDSTGTKMADS